MCPLRCSPAYMFSNVRSLIAKVGSRSRLPLAMPDASHLHPNVMMTLGFRASCLGQAKPGVQGAENPGDTFLGNLSGARLREAIFRQVRREQNQRDSFFKQVGRGKFWTDKF